MWAAPHVIGQTSIAPMNPCEVVIRRTWCTWYPQLTYQCRNSMCMYVLFVWAYESRPAANVEPMPSVQELDVFASDMKEASSGGTNINSSEPIEGDDSNATRERTKEQLLEEAEAHAREMDRLLAEAEALRSPAESEEISDLGASAAISGPPEDAQARKTGDNFNSKEHDITSTVVARA